MQSEDKDDERKSVTPIKKRPVLIKSKTNSYIDASDKSKDYLKFTPRQMKSKKQRVTIQCKDNEENDEVIQRKYKRTENDKHKKKVSDYARKQIIEQASSDEPDEHSFSNINEIKNDKPQRESGYDLETDSMQEYD